MQSERRDCVSIGILGCAIIARKNIRAIQLAGESDIGEAFHLLRFIGFARQLLLSERKIFCGTVLWPRFTTCLPPHELLN